jgi:hypothetical protein
MGRAATILLLLLSIAVHGLRPVDIDLELHPAPFSAYDDDIVLASLAAKRGSTDLGAIRDAGGGKGKLPATLLAIVLPNYLQVQVPGARRSSWFASSVAAALRAAAYSPYRARGPPAA